MKKISDLLLIAILVLTLAPSVSAQKKDTIQVVGHDHMDMNLSREQAD